MVTFCLKALEKADQARMSAVSSSQTVKSALDTVEDIINELGELTLILMVALCLVLCDCVTVYR